MDTHSLLLNTSQILQLETVLIASTVQGVYSLISLYKFHLNPTRYAP